MPNEEAPATLFRHENRRRETVRFDPPLSHSVIMRAHALNVKDLRSRPRSIKKDRDRDIGDRRITITTNHLVTCPPPSHNAISACLIVKGAT
eukprot:scaffold297705_cov44-Tisochrysis_lutea.AAC.1